MIEEEALHLHHVMKHLVYPGCQWCIKALSPDDVARLRRVLSIRRVTWITYEALHDVPPEPPLAPRRSIWW